LDALKALRTNGANGTSESRRSLRTSNSGYALDSLQALRTLIDKRDFEPRRMASLIIFFAVEEDISRCGCQSKSVVARRCI
jgi:hypothetical protein